MKSVPEKLPVNTDLIVDTIRPVLPHESDEKTDSQPIVPTKVMKQAYKDLQRGLVDTDLHGQRGVEEVLKK
jgi:hypothetical protein